MSKKYLSASEIYDGIKLLSRSQGFYGRILETLDEMDDSERQETLEKLESRHYSDIVEMVMDLES